ncbi:LEA type 2 family protein [Ectopseudomonas mendocina]|uniref:LEA type 2 family protein n=1 Tax=Ectopseudomonas mendocina TaxID=300 RepID=A0ABZ2RCI8_ECTME
MFLQAKSLQILSLTLFLGLLSGLSGCSSTGSLKSPEIALLKVEVVKARLLEQHFNLRFRIDNPNSFSLPISQLEYQVTLNNVELTKGEADVSLSVPAHGHSTFSVPVRTNLWRHVRQVVKALEQPDEAIPYQFKGSVKTGWFFGQRVHMSRNGEIIPGDYIPE